MFGTGAWCRRVVFGTKGLKSLRVVAWFGVISLDDGAADAATDAAALGAVEAATDGAADAPLFEHGRDECRTKDQAGAGNGAPGQEAAPIDQRRFGGRNDGLVGSHDRILLQRRTAHRSAGTGRIPIASAGRSPHPLARNAKR